MNKKIVVIGGGISGLAAAHRITELSPETDIVLLESSDRLGGVIRTQRCSECLIESAADNFITTPPAAVEQRTGESWSIQTNGAPPSKFVVDGIVIAATAHKVAKLLTNVDQSLMEQLAQIEYASCAVISLALAGSSLHGVGVPACITSGERAAEKLVDCPVEKRYRKIAQVQ